MDESKAQTRKRVGPFRYLVCRLEAGREGGRLVPLEAAGDDAPEGCPPPYVLADTPAQARAAVFLELTATPAKRSLPARPAPAGPMAAVSSSRWRPG